MKKMLFGDFPQQNQPIEEDNLEPMMYAASYDDPDDDREEADDEDNTENAPRQSDWGAVDPLEHDGPPGAMDPSAPGSAV